MDIVQLYQDYSIIFATEGHKHCRPGWVNTECPFCTGNPGLHLGYKISENRFVCWRCGGHSIDFTVSKLLNISLNEAKEIVSNYGGITIVKEKALKIRKLAFKFPSNIGDLSPAHMRYLERRGFDPIKLEREWGLFGTGPISNLEVNKKIISYKHRIIIPFEWDDQIVSFDSRDITGKTDVRYLACPIERELIEHKKILYGKQKKWKETGICVEGPTDVWRFGEFSFAVSGIKYTPWQLRTIARRFKRVFVCFDDDPQAIEQANKLVAELKFRGVNSFKVNIEGDPGSMSQSEANYLVKQLIK